ncbi:MAG: hypothetical protein WA888_14720 [Burkholderiaceae bacterium]
MTFTEASAAVIQCGTEQPDQPGKILTAGPMSVEFDNGQLRYLRVNGVEVLRAVGFLVRDENWGTYVPEISNLVVDQRSDGFSVSFRAVCQRDDQKIVYDASVEGKPNGALVFVGEAVPTTDFLTARTGFVVLHPLKGVAGQRVRVEHVDGSTVDETFPEAVDPVQPFLNIRALTHEVMPGLKAKVLMEGDTFEMEDHRNWTDASFKTYVRPLILPWPYTLKAGEAVRQSVTVSFDGEVAQAKTDDKADFIEISIGKVSAAVLPPIGLGVPAEEVSYALAHSDLLTNLAPRFLVCHFDPRENHGPDHLTGYKTLSERTGAQVQLEVVVDSVADFAQELTHLAAMVKEAGLILTGISVVPTGDLKSILPGGDRPPAPDLNQLYAAAASAFPGIEIGGGMFSFFTELNRKRVPTDQLNFVQNTTCPIVHAADDRSVMETLEALPFQVATARQFIGDSFYRVGPSGIGCRDNPHGATWTPNPENVRVCLTKHDPRQRGLFGAAWVLGYIATLARSGVDAISIGAPTGPLGLIFRKGEHPQPAFDEFNGTAVFPAYHVLRRLIRGVGSTLADCESSMPDAVQCLAFAGRDGGIDLCIANLTAVKKPILIKSDAGAQLRGVVLDQSNFQAACTDPIAFQSNEGSIPMQFELAPYAVAMLGLN